LWPSKISECKTTTGKGGKSNKPNQSDAMVCDKSKLSRSPS
jgi:hypothetical protein